MASVLRTLPTYRHVKHRHLGSLSRSSRGSSTLRHPISFVLMQATSALAASPRGGSTSSSTRSDGCVTSTSFRGEPTSLAAPCRTQPHAGFRRCSGSPLFLLLTPLVRGRAWRRCSSLVLLTDRDSVEQSGCDPVGCTTRAAALHWWSRACFPSASNLHPPSPSPPLPYPTCSG